MSLEKLCPYWLRRRFYNQFLKTVKSEMGKEWEWDAKLDSEGRKQKKFLSRMLNIERTVG